MKDQSDLKTQANGLIQRLYEANVPLGLVKSCLRDIHSLADLDQNVPKETWVAEAQMDTEEEDELYEEIDSINQAQERAQELNLDIELESARLWNSAALKVVEAEKAYQILYHFLSPSGTRGRESDPEASLVNIAQSLLILGVDSYLVHVYMDRIIDEVAKGTEHLQALVPCDWYKWNGKGIRMSALIAASRSFRQALIEMPILEPLCKFKRFPVSHLFEESELRLILEDCKIVSKNKDEVLYDQYQGGQWSRHWYMVIEGQVKVVRMQNEVELASCQASEGIIFGAHSSLQGLQALRHKGRTSRLGSEPALMHVSQESPGVIIKASHPCVLIQMKLSGLQEVCSRKKAICLPPSVVKKRVSLVQKEMMESRDRDLSSDVLPTTFHQVSQHATKSDEISEVDRKTVRDSLEMLDKVWASFSLGAKTIPRAALEEMKELLGEGGLQAYNDVFKPMYAEDAPIELRAEIFWHCWSQFLSESCLDAGVLGFPGLESLNNPSTKLDHLSGLPMDVPIDSKLSGGKSIFDEQESFQERLFWWACEWFPWAFEYHRISTGFFEKPIEMLEAEFCRVAGSATEPLQGESIRQYLILVMIDFPSPICLEHCREFCRIFNKPFDIDTKIYFQEVPKMMAAIERNKGLHLAHSSRPFIRSCINPNFVLVRVVTFLARLVVLYHILCVPVRIGFMPFPSFTHKWVLYSDLPADVAVLVHVVLSLNTAFKNDMGSWVTDRCNILRQSDLICFLGMVPLDWFGYLCGLSHEPCLWLRFNKMLLFFSDISPKVLLFNYRQDAFGKIHNLVVTFLLILHMCACIWYCLGRTVPKLMPGPALSWLYADETYSGTDGSFDRNVYYVTRPSTSIFERYVGCLWWVAASICANGLAGSVRPQNFVEILWTIMLMILNMTLFRWVYSEASSLVMNADETSVQARQHLQRVTMFITGGRFSPELKREIRTHFKSVQNGDELGQDTIFAGMSHSLRVELARFMSMEALTKSVLFGNCSDQFLTDICVLVREENFVPEETVHNAGDACKKMFIVVRQSPRELAVVCVCMRACALI
jgi:flagellar biosynthesis/type III secretory pathway chaperone